MKYVMHENMFYKLVNVRGFTNLNGESYQEHLVLQLNLKDKLKDLVLKSESDEDAKNILKENNIKFTHDYNN